MQLFKNFNLKIQVFTKKLKRLFYLFTLSILITSCSTTMISYVPRLNLDVSPKTINKSVQINKFIDSSPTKNKTHPLFGLSVTNNESITNGGLALAVTNAVVSDFSKNGLFKTVSRKLEHPDFVIKGEIKKFTGKYKRNVLSKVIHTVATASVIAAPIAENSWIFLGAAPELIFYLGIPMAKNTTEIEIILKLYDHKNNLISTYTGKANGKISMTVYTHKMLAITKLTNKTFDEVIMQIREQILNDIDKLQKSNDLPVNSL